MKKVSFELPKSVTQYRDNCFGTLEYAGGKDGTWGMKILPDDLPENYKFVKRIVRCVNVVSRRYFQPQMDFPFREGDFGVCSSEDDFLVHGKYWFIVVRQKDLKSHRVPAENFAIVSCSEVGDETC